ncbi:MAG: DUF401 family protein [Candidatus Altiarchaeota archaeon]
MIVITKLACVFILLVLLIRKGVNVGLTLLLGAFFLGLLFSMSLGDIAFTAYGASVAPRTLTLLAIVLLITLLGNVLKHMENLGRIASSLENLLPDVRITLAAIPAFIGLLPMPGGAMVSAPMTGEVADKVGLDAETKTVVNYWFRHIWEYSFPLYPGVILSASIFGITYADIIRTNGPVNVAAILAGTFLVLAGIKGTKSKNRDYISSLKTLIFSVWPVVAVVAANLLFGVDLVVALVTVITILFIQSRFFSGFLKTIFKESIRWPLIILIPSIMIFKAVIEGSGAFNGLPELFVESHIPIPLILFAIPFTVGLLVGVTESFVGVSFPLLSAFIEGSGFNFSYFMLAYVGGFMGVMLSPVHLCLILSREYYGSDLRKVYMRIIPLAASVTAATALLYIFGWPP